MWRQCAVTCEEICMQRCSFDFMLCLVFRLLGNVAPLYSAAQASLLLSSSLCASDVLHNVRIGTICPLTVCLKFCLHRWISRPCWSPIRLCTYFTRNPPACKWALLSFWWVSSQVDKVRFLFTSEAYRTVRISLFMVALHCYGNRRFHRNGKEMDTRIQAGFSAAWRSMNLLDPITAVKGSQIHWGPVWEQPLLNVLSWTNHILRWPWSDMTAFCQPTWYVSRGHAERPPTSPGMIRTH